MSPVVPPIPTVHPLTTAAEARPFAALAHVSVRLGLDRLAEGSPLIAVGAEASGEAVGLAVAGLASERAYLLWACVRPDCRRAGLGRRLLDAVEAAAAARGATVAVARWLEGKPSEQAVARLLAGWGPPIHRATLYWNYGEDTGRIVRLPWVLRPPERSGYDVFPWRELGASERDRLDAELDRGELAGTATATFDPFAARRFPIDPDTSMGIRHGGRVVGWLINRTMRPGVTLIDQMWLEPEHRWTAASVAALGRSIREIHRLYHHLPGLGCVWVTEATNRSMMAFNARRLAPYATRVVRQFESTRGLADG